MTSSQTHKEPFVLLQQAVALHRAGARAQALPLYDRVLAMEPGNGWALFFRGIAAEEEGEPALAEQLFEQAGAAGFNEPDLPMARGALALKQGHWAQAQAQFEAAARTAPEIAALWTNLGLALKRQGRLPEAAAAWAEGLRLRRGFPADPAAILDPQEQRALRRTNTAKLNHDLEQLQWLRRSGRLGAEMDPAIAALGALAQAPSGDPLRLLDPSDRDLGAAGPILNRCLHLGDGAALPQSPLSRQAMAALAAADAASGLPWPAGAEAAEAAEEGSADRLGVTVIDDVLTPVALARLEAFLRQSTIWFEAKDHGGHVGAYLEEGLAQPLLLQLAAALQAAMPRLLGGLALAQLWGYSYAAEGSGTDIHADAGRISVNLWLTPGHACLSGGGLVLYDTLVPADWAFADVNGQADRLRAWLQERRPGRATIPYRGNRLLLFDGRAPHRTEPFRFRPGFANRRLNLTFLFDAPDSGIAASQWR